MLVLSGVFMEDRKTPIKLVTLKLDRRVFDFQFLL